MRRTRQELEQIEQATLSSVAQYSAASLGREYPEPPHPFRTQYQRDRSRIIHSKSFRRLDSKTQVFLSGSGDHLRNRLTHTIEVASVSRTIARALGLNEDLAEAIALAHDLGHPPFGHSGEETLNRLMRAWGGFEHNVQSLRVVQVLEARYPKFPGLNLSREVLEGLRKHEKFHEAPETGSRYACPSLEAQIANLADEITYYSHDLEDGLDFNLLGEAQLSALEIWRSTREQVSTSFPEMDSAGLQTYVVRSLIDREVEDVIATSQAAIEHSGVRTVEDVRSQPRALICYGEEFLRMNREMRAFLYKHLYFHPRVAGANQAACELLEEVFVAFVNDPRLLGNRAAARIEMEGVQRTICDYISGMTDLYLIAEHERLFPDRAEARRVVQQANLPRMGAFV